MKFLIFVFLPASPFIPTSPFINFGNFCNLSVYCTLPVYYFGRNLPASWFIPPFPSIWNSRVSLKIYKWNNLKLTQKLWWITKRFLHSLKNTPQFQPEQVDIFYSMPLLITGCYWTVCFFLTAAYLLAAFLTWWNDKYKWQYRYLVNNFKWFCFVLFANPF